MYWQIGYNFCMTKQLQRHNEPDWVVVYTTAVFPEAHIIAGRLQSEGIEPYIHTQPGASAMGITLGTFGISVLVRPADYDAAMLLLHGEPDNDDDDLLPDTTDEQIIIWDDDDEE
jgi:hypothetical protein